MVGTQAGRLIAPFQGPGALQMAIDDWLLNQVIAGSSPGILRFYTWEPAAVSLGYHQSPWPELAIALQTAPRHLECVRRPTGGRAVLHQGDLTYAIALPLARRSRQQMYALICDAWISACQSLGLHLQYGNVSKGYHHQTNCFALATPADLVTVAGYKLIGNAQLRREHCVLQHGSIRLWPDPALDQAILGQTSKLLQSPVAIPPYPAEAWLQQLMQAATAALGRQLSMVFQPTPLTEAELKHARLVSDRFKIPLTTLPKPATSNQEDTVLPP